MYSDHVLYMFGGYTSDSAPSDQLWSFHITKRRWQLETLTYAAGVGKRIRHDFGHFRFDLIAFVQRPRYLHVAMESLGRKMFIFGGKIDGNATVREVHNPYTRTQTNRN